jgi:hypothetical protein
VANNVFAAIRGLLCRNSITARAIDNPSARPKKTGGDCVSGEGRRVQWETKRFWCK